MPKYVGEEPKQKPGATEGATSQATRPVQTYTFPKHDPQGGIIRRCVLRGGNLCGRLIDIRVRRSSDIPDKVEYVLMSKPTNSHGFNRNYRAVIVYEQSKTGEYSYTGFRMPTLEDNTTAFGGFVDPENFTDVTGGK